MILKPLVQVKQDDAGEKLSVTILITEGVVKSLLETLAANEDKRAAIAIEGGDVEIAVEIHRPGESKNLHYKKNLERPGWTTISVATL